MPRRRLRVGATPDADAAAAAEGEEFLRRAPEPLSRRCAAAAAEAPPYMPRHAAYC